MQSRPALDNQNEDRKIQREANRKVRFLPLFCQGQNPSEALTLCASANKVCHLRRLPRGARRVQRVPDVRHARRGRPPTAACAWEAEGGGQAVGIMRQEVHHNDCRQASGGRGWWWGGNTDFMHQNFFLRKARKDWGERLLLSHPHPSCWLAGWLAGWWEHCLAAQLQAVARLTVREESSQPKAPRQQYPIHLSNHI